MEIKGEKVNHKFFGTGIVTKQTTTHVFITFDNGEKKFQYPIAFKQFLVFCNPAVQEYVIAEIEKDEQIKSEQEKIQKKKHSKPLKFRVFLITPIRDNLSL